MGNEQMSVFLIPAEPGCSV